MPRFTSAAEPLLPINIDAGPLKSSLRAYALQTHQQLVFDESLLADRWVPALKGQFTSDEALQRLLSGTNVDVEHAGSNVLVLKAHTAPPTRSQDTTPDAAGSTMTSAPPATVDAQADNPPVAGDDKNVQPNKLTEVVVTGSHIRGLTVNASPVVTVGQEDLRRNGDATIADALDRLPQNFSGQSTPNDTLIGSDATATNTALSQGVNLRGLGTNATLVLVNGRRLAGSGAMGDFVDVSSIPTAAVDHVDVLLDGASAIYGSDAVAGVVNVVMKKNYQGADTSVRYGEDAGGKAPSLQVGQTFGATWDGGHLLFSYEYQHNDQLAASARRYTANSDLTALGGSNWDVIYSDPGNILSYVNGGFVSSYAIPGGNGVGLTAADFVAGTENLNNFRQDTDILPNQTRHGLYFDVGQDLDSKTSVDLEGRYSLRVYSASSSASEPILTVTNANPYFVSLDGATSEEIGYSTINSIGPARQSGTDKNFDLSAGITRDLTQSWRLSAYAGFAEEVGRTFYSHIFNSAHADEALGNTADDPATGFSTAVDGYFNPYGDGSSNSKTILDFIGDGYFSQVDISQVTTFSIQADGNLFSLPAGQIKAAFGAQYRHERFEPNFMALTTDTPYLDGYVSYDRDVSSVYGELNIPLFGSANALPGLQKLNLSIAGRAEHYDDVGSTANPKVGLSWSPVKDLVAHMTYGTSFRAPALSEVDGLTSLGPAMLSNGTNQVLTLFLYGGNKDLKPETATTWTAGLDWSPEALKGFHAGVDWFDIDFTNQIAEPGVVNSDEVLINPAYANLVTRIDSSNAADVAKVQALLDAYPSSTSGLYPANAYSAIIDARYVNTASLVASGVDFNTSYAFDLDQNHFKVGASGTYLYNYLEKTTPDAPAQQLVSTAGYPVNFRGRVTADWTRGPYSSALTVNYVNSYRDTVNNRPIDSWTTVDCSVSWRSRANDGATKGVSFTVAVQNLLDQDPPFYNSDLGVGYDPANANPLGRVVSVQLDKHW